MSIKLSKKQRWVLDRVELSEKSGGEGVTLSAIQEFFGHKRLAATRKIIGPLILEGLVVIVEDRVRLGENVRVCPHCNGAGILS